MPSPAVEALSQLPVILKVSHCHHHSTVIILIIRYKRETVNTWRQVQLSLSQYPAVKEHVTEEVVLNMSWRPRAEGREARPDTLSEHRT
jgi:hypothetical protein